MKSIHPNLFTKVMRLPEGKRVDILEFLGATPVDDVRLRQMLNEADALLQANPANDQPLMAAV